MTKTATGTETAAGKQVVTGREVGAKLAEAGLLPPFTNRIVIDIPKDGVVMIYFHCYAGRQAVDDVLDAMLSGGMEVQTKKMTCDHTCVRCGTIFSDSDGGRQEADGGAWLCYHCSKKKG